jgi:hypothetical protein
VQVRWANNCFWAHFVSRLAVKVKALKNGSSYSGAIECARRIPRDWFFLSVQQALQT